MESSRLKHAVGIGAGALEIILGGCTLIGGYAVQKTKEFGNDRIPVAISAYIAGGVIIGDGVRRVCYHLREYYKISSTSNSSYRISKH